MAKSIALSIKSPRDIPNILPRAQPKTITGSRNIMWSFYVFVITFETKPQNEIVKNFFLMPSRIFAFMKICFCTVANKTLMHPNNARIVVKAIIVLSYPIIDLLPSLSKNSMRVL